MIAEYKSHQLIINDTGLATIVPPKDHTVWGTIWEVSEVRADRFGHLHGHARGL